MKQNSFFATLLAVSTALAMAVTVSAQEWPLSLYQVEPGEGLPGEYLQLRLRGRGFLSAEITGIEIDGLEVRDYWIESDEEMGADLYIPESAPPGPRMVMMVASLGENEPVTAFLEAGFYVLEREQEAPPDEPPYEPPGDVFPWWLIIGGLGLLGAMGVTAVALVVVLRKASLKRAWQRQASSQELPENCVPGSYINLREKLEVKAGRWKVTGLKVTLYQSAGNKAGKTYTAPGELVSQIDKAARQRLLAGEDEQLHDLIGELAKTFSAHIIASQNNSETTKDVYLEAHLEGGSALASFARYHCEGQPGAWKKVLKWQAELKAVDHLPSAIRGPRESEFQPGYQVYLEAQLKVYLTRVTSEAARLL